MLEPQPFDAALTRDDSPSAPLVRTFAATRLEHRDAIVIAVAGELDLAAAPELDRVLREADPTRPVVVDLTACEFIDSSGLLILIRHSQRLRGFVLCCTPGDAASRLLNLAGIADHHAGRGAPLHLFPSRERALEALHRAATSNDDGFS